MSLYETLMNELKNFSLDNYDEAQQKRRIAICQSCENYSGDEEHKCNVCKCNINWRVLFMPNSCPAGKWPRNGG